MNPKQTIKQRIEETIKDMKRKNPKLTARQIYAELKERYKGEQVTVRNIYYVLENSKLEPSNLDRPWSVGACQEYPVMQGHILFLLEIQSMLLAKARYLTIRRARWLALLEYSLTELLEIKYPDQSILNLRLYQISSFYVAWEQRAELNGEPLDTKILDKKFIIDGDVSAQTITSFWLDEFILDPIEDKKKSANPVSMEKQILSRLSPDKQKIFKSLINEMITVVDENMRQEFIKEFNKLTPDMQNLVMEWAALSRRRDLENLTE